MKKFIRELFRSPAEQQAANTPPAPPPIEHQPSIYDSLIEGLEGEVAGLKSMIEFHEKQANDLDTRMDHKREQLMVLRAHRDDERREPPMIHPGAVHYVPEGWKPTDYCTCDACKAARAEQMRYVFYK